MHSGAARFACLKTGGPPADKLPRARSTRPAPVKAQSVVTRNVVRSGEMTGFSPCGVPEGAQSYGTGCAR